MKKASLRYIAVVVTLMLFSVFALVGCKQKSDNEKGNAGTESGLQEKEDEEIDSGKFEDIFSDKSDDDKQNVSQDSTTNSDNNNNGNNDNQDNNDNNGNSSSVTKPRPPEQEDTDQEDKVEDNNQNEQDNDAPITEEEDKEQGWGPVM